MRGGSGEGKDKGKGGDEEEARGVERRVGLVGRGGGGEFMQKLLISTPGC